MKESARKYSKILYFVKNKNMRDMIWKTSQQKKAPNKKRIDKHYPFNCVSKHLPLAGLSAYHSDLMLPCGFKNGESWGALKKCWKGYRIAKVNDDEILMREYARRIQTLEEQLGVPTASFPNLGMLGDLFFLYDKEKEMQLRQQYMHDNVVCDRFDVNSIQELIDNGDAKEFDSVKAVRNYMNQEHYQDLADDMKKWAFHESTQATVRAVQRKWNAREKVKDELRHIKQELGALQMHHLEKSEQVRIKRRKEHLMQQKILKEAELKSVETITLVKTDEGWKYAKEIIKDSMRKKIKCDYEPQYYLTDLKGRRLGNYKEEQELGYAADPVFYRLYLEDKEWEKIYSPEAQERMKRRKLFK
jgi:gluconate kinase